MQVADCLLSRVSQEGRFALVREAGAGRYKDSHFGARSGMGNSADSKRRELSILASTRKPTMSPYTAQAWCPGSLYVPRTGTCNSNCLIKDGHLAACTTRRREHVTQVARKAGLAC